MAIGWRSGPVEGLVSLRHVRQGAQGFTTTKILARSVNNVYITLYGNTKRTSKKEARSPGDRAWSRDSGDGYPADQGSEGKTGFAWRAALGA